MSLRPLAKKLKLKENQTILVINAPTHYEEVLTIMPGVIKLTSQFQAEVDSIHLFVKNKAELDQWAQNVVEKLAEGSIIWVAYPKKTSKIQTDLTRDVGWDEFLQLAPFQGITLISIDETWSAVAFRKMGSEKIVKRSATSDQDSQIINQYIDTKNRVVKVPEDLAAAFQHNKVAATFYSELSFTYQKEYVVWLVTAKRAETRAKRLQATLEKLSQKIKSPIKQGS